MLGVTLVLAYMLSSSFFGKFHMKKLKESKRRMMVDNLLANLEVILDVSTRAMLVLAIGFGVPFFGMHFYKWGFQ